MEPEASSIKIEMNAKTTQVNINEALCPVLGDLCQGWVVTDTNSMVVEIAASRGSIVLEVHFPYYKRPVTSDGLPSYNIL